MTRSTFTIAIFAFVTTTATVVVFAIASRVEVAGFSASGVV